MKKSTRNEYKRRLRKLHLYIESRLDEQLTLKELSEVACFSEFHFHRIFTAFTGESLHSHIRRLRLERAAGMLVSSESDITDLAFQAGYQTPASFTRAFKKEFGKTPTEFRNSGRIVPKETFLHFTNNTAFMEEIMKPEILEMNPLDVLSVRKTGPYAESATRAWEELCDFAGPAGLLTEQTKCIGISYDNPDITEADKLRFDACISFEGEPAASGNVFKQTIQGGKYAVFTHKGPYENLIHTYRAIYAEWFPESGHELSESTCFELYVNDPRSVKPEDLLTQIHIPLK